MLKKWLRKIIRPGGGKARLDGFIKNGLRPWTPGYEEYKWAAIAKAVNSDFNALIGTEKYGYRIDERVVELPWLLSRLNHERAVMLDAGSALNHGPILAHDKIRSKKLFISTLSPEGFARPDLGISYVYEDLRTTCFRERFFDIIACISTLEHIGMDNTFLYTRDASKKEKNPGACFDFIETLRSLIKPDGRLYLSFPFGRARDHGWFQVFDSAMVDRVIERFSPKASIEKIFYYSEDRWHESNREEAAEASCFDIHVNKTYEPDYLAFSRSVACLELVK